MHQYRMLKSIWHRSDLYSPSMVATIALKFNVEGSVVLHYTTLNVDAL
jgi:hypothetical protein